MSDTIKYLGPEQVAERLGMNPHTVRTMLRDGKLPGRKVGVKWLTHPDQLDEFIRQPHTPDTPDTTAA